MIFRNKLVLVMGLTLLSSLGAATLSSKEEAASDNLPMLLISYAYGLANGMDIGSGNQSRDLIFGKLYAPLEKSLDRVHADLPTKLAFVRQSYIVQPTAIGNRIISQQGKGTLYVTEAISEVSSGSIAIVSSVSPETTTIFLIDDRLHVTLIYDSVVANHFAVGESCDPLGQIAGVEVMHQNVLKLTESNTRWSNKHKRVINLDAKSKSPVLHCS